MSKWVPADASRSIINFQDEPEKPPPKLEVGLAGLDATESLRLAR